MVFSFYVSESQQLYTIYFAKKVKNLGELVLETRNIPLYLLSLKKEIL